MDTMMMTKVTAALCGSLLVFLLGKWAADEIYHMAGHGPQSYVIDLGEEAVEEEVADEVPFAEILASASG